MVAKIVPSPDWFVGVDSIPLCKDGQWQESGEHLLRPLDAGSQQGKCFILLLYIQYSLHMHTFLRFQATQRLDFLQAL